jgi:hypothetical protein
MKILSIRQPWLSLILSGDKDIENRTWSTNYRGMIALHASQKLDTHSEHYNPRENYALSAVVGVVELVDIVTASRSLWAEPDHYHWVLKNPIRLPQPIHMHGKLRLFDVKLTF